MDSSQDWTLSGNILMWAIKDSVFTARQLFKVQVQSSKSLFQISWLLKTSTFLLSLKHFKILTQHRPNCLTLHLIAFSFLVNQDLVITSYILQRQTLVAALVSWSKICCAPMWFTCLHLHPSNHLVSTLNTVALNLQFSTYTVLPIHRHIPNPFRHSFLNSLLFCPPQPLYLTTSSSPAISTSTSTFSLTHIQLSFCRFWIPST